jgi:CheY-like chemotaxis protein
MAEDNLINQRVAKLILQRAGLSVDVATDGVETLEAHKKNPYDIVLMDCQMPHMDGFEASRRFVSCRCRSRPSSPLPPVLWWESANAA